MQTDCDCNYNCPGPIPLKRTGTYPELSEPYVPHPIRRNVQLSTCKKNKKVQLSTAASARAVHLIDYFRRGAYVLVKKIIAKAWLAYNL